MSEDWEPWEEDPDTYGDRIAIEKWENERDRAKGKQMGSHPTRQEGPTNPTTTIAQRTGRP